MCAGDPKPVERAVGCGRGVAALVDSQRRLGHRCPVVSGLGRARIRTWCPVRSRTLGFRARRRELHRELSEPAPGRLRDIVLG
jgi:hypothetical protein